MRAIEIFIVSFKQERGYFTNAQVKRILQEIGRGNSQIDETDVIIALILLLSRTRKRRVTRNMSSTKKRSSRLRTVVKRYTLS